MSIPKGERWTGSAFNARRRKSSQGGPTEWNESRAAKISRDLIYQPLGPSVEGIGQTIIGLLGG